MSRSSRLPLLSILVLMAACAGAAPDPDTAPATPPRLRVLSYNVKHGLGMDGRIDLERIATVIRAQKPDIVALQEIDSGVDRSDGVDQADELGELCGMTAVFGEFMDYGGGRYGMALLSRFDIEDVTNHRLPEGAEPRTALTARIRLADGRRVVVAGIHFYRTEAERVAQAHRLVEVLADDPDPVVLVGDFNSQPGSPVFEVLAASWRPLPKSGDPFTFPADAPDREIDFVLVPATGSLRGVDCRVIDEPVASDHRPVLAVLEYAR